MASTPFRALVAALFGPQSPLMMSHGVQALAVGADVTKLRYADSSALR